MQRAGWGALPQAARAQGQTPQARLTQGHYNSQLGASRVSVWGGSSSCLAGPRMVGRALASSSSKGPIPPRAPPSGPRLKLTTS